MDYEKKYNEAIKRAKQHCADYVVETIFPELKESEDERIRKDIIWCLKHSGIKESNPINPHVTTIAKDAIAWLEKQGEQKPAEWSKEDKLMLDEIIDFFENGTVKLQHDLSLYASWLKSLKERYTWKPSIAQLNAISIVSKGNITDDIEAIVSLYQDLKKLREE